MLIKLSPFKKAVLSFVSILLLGFIAMNIFWLYMKNSTSLPGLCFYKAATYGDGICLPLLVASLIYYVSSNKPINKKQKRISIYIGIIFGLLAIVWQAEWIINKNTILNWTLPRQHHFNAAGWYHAIFFVFMFFTISNLITKVWFVRINSKNECTNYNTMLSYTMIWLAGSGFVFLIALDDLSKKVSYTILLFSIFIIFLFLATLFSSLSIKKFSYNCFICILSGTSSSLGFAFFLMKSVNFSFIFAIANFLLSFVFIFYNPEKPKVLLSYILMISLPVLFLTLGLLTLSGLPFYIMCLLIILVPCTIAYGQKSNSQYFVINKKYSLNISKPKHVRYIALGGTLLLISLLTYILIIENINTILINIPFKFALGYIALSSIKYNFKYIIETEKMVNESIGYDTANKTSKKLKRVKMHFFLLCVAIVVGLLLFIFLTINIIVNYNNTIIIQSLPWTPNNTLFLIIMILSIIILLFLKRIHKHISNKKILLPLILSIFVIAYISLILNLLLIKSPFFKDMHPAYICSIFMIIGSSIMLCNSFINNIAKIRGYKPDLSTKSIASIIFIGSLATLSIAIAPSINSSGARETAITSIILSSISLCLSNIVFPVLIANIVQKNNTINTKIATTSPIGGIAQDGFLVWLINVLGGIIPIYLIAVTNNFTQWLEVTLSIILCLYWPLSFCLGNCVEHIDRQYNAYKKLIKNNKENATLIKQQFIALNKYIIFLSFFAFLSLLLFSLVPVIIEALIIAISDNNVTFKEKYFPQKYKIELYDSQKHVE